MNSHKPLDGRIAVVTGASSGIGEATALRLASDGARVALLARRADRLSTLAGKLGDSALALPTDVTNPDDLDAAALAVEKTFGAPDLVIANAGVMLVSPFEEGRRTEWERMLRLNMLGVFDTARAFLPGLLAAGAEGRRADLVIVSSLGARVFMPGFNVYNATKAGVSALAGSLRVEFGARGLRVTNVEPGVTESELGDRIEHDELREILAAGKAEMGPLEASDIADAIADAVSRPPNVHIRELIVHASHLV